jgi:hypothetical protein
MLLRLMKLGGAWRVCGLARYDDPRKRSKPERSRS